MDLLAIFLIVISLCYSIAISFDSSLKMVEKVIGSGIFIFFGLVGGAGVMYIAVGYTPQVHITYEDEWTEVTSNKEGELMFKEFKPYCIVDFDVDIPFTIFYGTHHEKIFSGKCDDLGNESNVMISEMSSNYRGKAG